jgi:hypothetical protein
MPCARCAVRQASRCATPYWAFSVRMPADRGGIEQDRRAFQRGQAGGLGIPLIPADQHAEGAEAGLEGFEAEVAGGEIIFFVEARVVRDVHLAVEAEQRAVGIQHRDGVVVETRRAFFEQGRDDHDARFFAAAPSASVDGPGIVSARSNSAASSFWQKYGVRYISGRQTTCAPAAAASAIFSAARRVFSAGSLEQRIWIKPTLIFMGSFSPGPSTRYTGCRARCTPALHRDTPA